MLSVLLVWKRLTPIIDLPKALRRIEMRWLTSCVCYVRCQFMLLEHLCQHSCNYCGLGTDLIDYAVEVNPFKIY